MSLNMRLFSEFYLFRHLIYTIYGFVMVSALLAGSSSHLKSTRPSTTFQMLRQNFNDPDMIYAPFAFWFWDTKLDPHLIAQMAQEMSEKGLNTGYIHGRIGLPPEQWLSPHWFQSFEVVLKQARVHNTCLGYCDEYWWPSGRANGKVLEANPDLKATSLNWRCIYGKEGERIDIPGSLFVVAAELADSQPGENARIRSKTLKVIGSGNAFEWTAPPGSWKIYIFNIYFHPGYDGGDVNYLDSKLADEFIKIAHKPYQKFVNDFGTRIPGAFVDHEGDYGWKLAWSDDLEKEYQHKKGKDIRLRMPLLLDEDIEGSWVTARYDWFDMVSDLYANNFLGVISDYLKSKGLYTISNLWEENLYFQAINLGDAFKAHRAVTMPGNDCLFQKALNVHDFKEIQSISEFEGTKFQSEILGVEGWEMTPVTMKKAVNSVICWGVSHIVPHGINLNRSLDSIPFPPDWFTSNPYWRYFNKWTDFARRASFINTHGYTTPDVLVLNPMSSIWALIGGEIFCDSCEFYESPAQLPGTINYNRLNRIDKFYTDIIEQLTSNRIEFLITDEYYLNKMKISGDSELIAKNHKFNSIILPDLFCIKTETARKILSFAKRGGTVYYVGEFPAASAEKGLSDFELQQLISRLKEYAVKLVDLKSQLQSHIRFMKGEFPMIQLHRVIDHRHFFWLVNNTDNFQNTTLMVKSVKGQAAKWDCESGLVTALPSIQNADEAWVELSFIPYEAFWLVFDPAQPPVVIKKNEKLSANTILIDHNWKVAIDHRIQPKMFNGQIFFPQYTDIAIGEKELIPWEDWGLKYFTGYVDYVNDFMIDLPQNDRKMTLSLGTVYHMAEVEINGVSCGEKLWPPFEFDITNLLVNGKNTIKVKVGNLLINYMNHLIDEHRLYSDEFYLQNRPKDYQSKSGLLGPVTIW